MSENNNPISGDPFQTLLDHFESHGIRYSCKREDRRASLTMNSGNALQKCRFVVAPSGDVLQIFIQYPLLVREKFRPLAMEYLTRANYGLVVGNFEMDCKDGEVRYHVAHVMPDGKLEEETIGRLFGTALGTADRYFGPFMRLLFAGENPEDAIFLAELDQHAEVIDSKKKSGAKPKRSKRPPSKGSRSKKSVQGMEKPQDQSPEIAPPSPASEIEHPPQDPEEGEDRKAA